MRLLTSKLLRRSRPSPPPPPLLHFFSHYSSSSSSSSHALFSSSAYHHHWQHNYNHRCSSALHSLSSHGCLSFSRRFFTQPDLSELEEPFLPVNVIISLLDSYHDITGFPWWIIISSSTVALRLAIFPLIVLQLKKLKRIGELLPELPPPFPPPLSGRNFGDQIALFWKEKKAAGCPSVFWFFSSFAVQVPCFFLWLMSVRRMSLDHHPGFDCLLCLIHPNVLEYLGLPKKSAAAVAPTIKERRNWGVEDIFILTKQEEISAQSLSPAELVSYSIKILSDGHKDAAIRLLRLALQKDPGYIRALLILGQSLLQNKHYTEATECLESAISKLLAAGYPTEVEEIDLLILSSQWAGIANVQQGKMEEGLLHLERIGQLEEPGDSKTKAHYYDGLIVLSSALLNVDRKAEAVKYLQKAVAYNPAYNVYFELLETDLNDFASDLASSRKDL